MSHRREAARLPALLAGLCLLLPLAGCEQGASPVVEFTDALARKDMDAAMSALTFVATLELEGTTFRGPAEIRDVLATLEVQSLPDDVKKSMVVEDGRVSWTQSYSTAEYAAFGIAPVEALVEATLTSSGISIIKWELTPDASAKLQAARTARVTTVLSSLESALNAHDGDAIRGLLHERARIEWLGDVITGEEQLTDWLKELGKVNARVERANEPSIDDDSAEWSARISTSELSRLALAPVDVKAMMRTSDGKITRVGMVPSPEVLARLKGLAAKKL
ncbi:MAG: hypothetical protein A2289_12715 [Deltaproteobacteria bacterium RIFOXYA12_FULL_58_15]|nr:MAG: hypothetical protein A2289_12715 [Deltaproteobacteria bacterium RIFOXYA12_FULL_58_15]OGR13989.1 MAG: hypothetical protein A2341_24725 [Deltaproteobacteria bacterium RIFOXYB12_FULL_58_9]